RPAVEWVNLRVVGLGLTGRAAPRLALPGDGRVERALTGTRDVVFDGRRRPCPTYDRAGLCPGDRLSGPAIVEEFGATTVVFPGQAVEGDRFANMVLTRVTGPPHPAPAHHATPAAPPPSAPL